MQVLHAGLFEYFRGDPHHDLLLVLQFLDAADQRNHDLRNHLDTLLGYPDGGFEDGARLHLRDLRIGDAQAAAAMAQHGVELMQFFHPLEQFPEHRLEVLHFGAELGVRSGEFPLLLDVGIGQDGEVHHQVFPLGQELVQRRIEGADHHRESVHGLEQACEIVALHGQEFLQCFAAALFVARQNHGLHVFDAALGEEHVLGAAEADAFGAEETCLLGIAGDVGVGAEAAGGLRVARDIGIGAHAKAAAELVGPTHKRLEDSRRRVGIHGVSLAGKNFTGGAVERQPVAFRQGDGLALDGDADFFPGLADGDFLGAGHAGRAHATADHRGVAGHAAARSENALGHFHAVNIVGHGLFAHQDDGSLGGLLHGVVGVEHDGPDRSSRRRRQALRQQRELLFGFGIEHRVQQLIELLRIDAQNGFLLVDETFSHHFDGDAYRGRTRALAVAGLQHEQLAVLNGELEILNIAIVLLEHAGNVAKLSVDGGIPLFELGDGVRGADAGHHVFALRVLQELAVEFLFAGGRVAREAHAGGRSLAHVAEDHGLHVDGGAQVVGNLVHLAIVLGAVVKPGPEHGIAGALELFHGFLREGLTGLLLHQLLIAHDDLLQVFRSQIGVELGLGLFLLAVEDFVEIVLADFEHYVAVHLNEAAVAIVGEARVVAFGGQRLHGLVVQPEVEDGVHHARHGELGARADAHQQGVAGVAEFLSHALFERLEGGEHLFVDAGGNAEFVLEVDISDFRRDREAGWHRQLGAGHFRESGALAAENIFHLSITVGGSVAERVYVLRHAWLL